MKTKRISILRLFQNVVLGFIAAFALSFVGVPALLTMTGVVLFNAAQIAYPNFYQLTALAGLPMAVQTEVWVQDIEETLYGSNTWLMRATNDSAYVNHKTVHVPRSGGAPTITKNLDHSTTPSTPALRADTTQDYNLNEYTTTPTKIPNIEQIQVSYSKRQSVLREHINAVEDRIALETLDSWTSGIAASDIFRTTGANTGLLPSGATVGTRLKVTAADIALISARMDEEEVPAEGRICIMPAVMFHDLFADTTLANIWATSSGNANILKEPQLMGRFMGFDIYVRGRVILFNTISGTTKLAVTAAASTGTAAAGAALFAQQSQIRFAKGAIVPYLDENSPIYYGDVMSLGVMSGAASSRATEVGIKVLAQGGVA